MKDSTVFSDFVFEGCDFLCWVLVRQRCDGRAQPKHSPPWRHCESLRAPLPASRFIRSTRNPIVHDPSFPQDTQACLFCRALGLYIYIYIHIYIYIYAYTHLHTKGSGFRNSLSDVSGAKDAGENPESPKFKPPRSETKKPEAPCTFWPHGFGFRV